MQRIIMKTLWIGLVAVISIGLHQRPAAAFGRFGTADPVVPPLECYPPQLNGLPQFIQTPPGTAVYRFSGNCNHGLTFRVEGKWTPTAGPNQPNASEAFDITGYEKFLPNRAPGGKIYVLASAQCTRDPWLNNPVCTKFGIYLPDDIRAMWTQLEELRAFPWTQNILSASDRSRLLTEYNRINNISTTPPVVTKRMDSQLTSPAPSILQPTAGQGFVEKTPIPIKIAPPQNWNVVTYMVQLQRRDSKANWILHTNLPVGAAAAHSAGYTEFGGGPPPGFSSTKGIWRLNAQASYPTKSGWSNWVEFSVTPSPAGLPPPSKLKDRIMR